MDCDLVRENFLTKFVIKGHPVFVKILWKNANDHLFHMQVFSGELSWTGEFTQEMCKAFRENFDEDVEQYSRNVKDSLKMKDDMYTYEFILNEDESNIAKFCWSRKFKNSSAKLLHGCVSLKKDEIASTKIDIIDFLLEENKHLSLALERHSNKAKKLESDLELWENEFKKVVDIKNTLETTLYGKFVQLLNTKKRRIQDLEDHLNEL